MPLTVVGLPNLVIPSSQASNAVGLLDDAWGLTIYAPAAITSTSGVAVQIEPTETGTNFLTLQSGGADVYVVQGRATVISPVPFKQIRMLSSVTEATDRIFTLTKAILV